MLSKSTLRDPLLLLTVLLAILWGWSCLFDDTGEPAPTYSVRDNKANDRAGVTIPSQGGTATVDLTSRTTWRENNCVIRRTVLTRGLTTSAIVTDQGVLTITGSALDAGTHLTTVTVRTRTENCDDPFWNNDNAETVRVAVNFD